MSLSPETRHRLTEEIHGAELCVLHPYEDSRGILTIGWGHNCEADPVLRDKLAERAKTEGEVTITQAAADRLFENDLAIAEDAVALHLPWAENLDQVRQATLVELAFNMGIGSPGGEGLRGKNPKMLAACQRGDWAAAKTELLDGPYRSQVGERADRLAHQLLTGSWEGWA